ncbi:MAG: signal transduction histidine kinase [Paracoccaceae bacterium]
MSSEPAHTTAPDPATLSTSDILIVDDSLADATLFRETVGALEGPKVSVTHCADYDSGLAAVAEGHFQIAFIDFRLGQQDGPALIAAAGGRLCSTPMVLLTGNAGPEVEREAMEAGALDFVDKAALSPQVLGRVIRYARHNHNTGRQLALSQNRYRLLAESAVEANMQKSRFFAEMSHELRTPLNAIIGFSEIIKDQVMGKLEGESLDRYLEYTEDIYNSSRHLLSLIDDLLDISKLEAGEYRCNPHTVVLSSLVNDTVRMTFAQSAAAGVDVRIEIADSAFEIFADRRLILQALMNVVSNAIKFTDRGGVVSIGTQMDTETVTLVVRDTGCGILEKDLEEIMLPYRQGSELQSRAGGGTGLGLTLTQSIMELHRGRISIDSEVGVGTTVYLVLPKGATAATQVA